MARQRQQRRRKIVSQHPLVHLAIILLSTADTSDEHTVALLAAHLALNQIRKERSEHGKFGPRGPYDRVKSIDFYDLILNRFTGRQFKNWLRYESIRFVFSFTA